MNIMSWISTAVVGGTLYRCEESEEYEIFEEETSGGFFVRRLVADCDDIGPLLTFKDAEDTLLKFLGMLVAFEEEAWRVVAAQTMQAALMQLSLPGVDEVKVEQQEAP